MWDERKRKANARKHGFDFADAAELFLQKMLWVQPDPRDYNEERWIGVGNLRGVMATIVFTTPSPGVVRIISLRGATKNEEALFYKNSLLDRLGSSEESEG